MCLTPSRVEATPVTFAFTVQITNTRNLTPAVPLIGGLTVGNTFSGTYTFDSGLVDSIPANVTLGQFDVVSSTAPFPLQLNLGGNAFGLGSTFQQIQQTQQVGAYFLEGDPVPGQVLPAGMSRPFFYLELDSSSVIYANPNILPLVPFILSNANRFNDSQFNFLWNGTNTGIGGTVISLQLVTAAPSSPVPEPATLILLGSGMLIVATRFRRDLKKR